MSDLQTLLRGMRRAEQGSDFVSRRLILADWLEERGDQRFEKLRSCDWLSVEAAARAVYPFIVPAVVEAEMNGQLPPISEEAKSAFYAQLLGQYLDLFPEVCICDRFVRVEIARRQMDMGKHHEGRIVRWAQEELKRQGHDDKKPSLCWDDSPSRRVVITQHCDHLCPMGRAEQAWLKAGKVSEMLFPWLMRFDRRGRLVTTWP